MIVCETERLRTRHFCLDDAEFTLRLLNEPSFVENIADKGVRTLADARAYLLSGPMASYKRFGFGLNRVELKVSSVPIGMCGLLKRDSLEDADIGYAFLPEYCAKGYAFESAFAVMNYANTALALERLVAVVNPANQRSIRLLEKLDFKYEKMVSLYESEPEINLYGINF